MDEALLCDQLTILRAGTVLITAPPREIMQRGRTTVRIWRGDQAEEDVISSSLEALPRLLERYGLDRSITRIELDEDSLETVMLSLIQEGEQ
jgi:ABC-type multidrug transport system ATPase subunit